MMTFTDLKKNLTKDVSRFPICKIALLGDSSTQLFNQAIKACGVLNRINFEIFEADFDQIEMQIFDPQSDLYLFKPQYVILFKSTEKLIEIFYKTDISLRSQFAQTQVDGIKNLWVELSKRMPCSVLTLNFVEINDNIYGNFGSKVERSLIFQLRKLNFELMNAAIGQKNVFITDVSSLQNTYGRQNSFDAKMFFSAKMSFEIDFLTEVAKNAVDIIRALMGSITKCIILDLDNTIWGGIIGDDGVNKIEIGELGVGRAFTKFQMWIKELKQRGIILAVCSKNTEEIAKEPFEKNPDMILHLDDIAVFIANWDNKATNIKNIQSILNIGFDSMVFIDDNPFERNVVRQMLPEVIVPELPEDPSEYIPYLTSLNLFETASANEDDASRTRQYQVEAQRVTFQKEFVSIDDYLANLGMSSVCRPFDDFYVPRIAQLTQRSNQFNLRTIRYTEQDISRILSSEKHMTQYFMLEDKFGDHGLISLLILEKREKNELFIDTWIMSCRVLSRGMEEFVLNKAVTLALMDKFEKLTAEYIPTPKNALVKDLYKKLGFIESNGLWELDLKNYEQKKVFIKEKKQ